MARRYGRRGHRRGGFKLPIISLAILGGQAAASWQISGGNAAGALNEFATFYTGYNFMANRWEASHLVVGYAPWIIKRFLLPIARPKLGGMKLPVSLS